MCNLSKGIREEAERIGESRGDERRAKSTALNLYRKEMSPEDIADAVGYPLETVEHWLGLVLA